MSFNDRVDRDGVGMVTVTKVEQEECREDKHLNTNQQHERTLQIVLVLLEQQERVDVSVHYT